MVSAELRSGGGNRMYRLHILRAHRGRRLVADLVVVQSPVSRPVSGGGLPRCAADERPLPHRRTSRSLADNRSGESGD
ncbi:hypothetical protein [Rhodococcus sp. BH5]|uniref:hypothetical protein n=1 Tax=Rhodococcus sp. BH5 TaxID=2871702 RepID=UPI0022CDB19D|nr:hypothetical protein [Rhodococcus sp. BH5]MCZ9635275.1 hypothetical protein [Rhodococcus sp. BH5]